MVMQLVQSCYRLLVEFRQKDANLKFLKPRLDLMAQSCLYPRGRHAIGHFMLLDLEQPAAIQGNQQLAGQAHRDRLID